VASIRWWLNSSNL